MLATFLLLITAAFAGQVKYDVDKGAAKWAFDVTWKDANAEKHHATFKLPAAAVKEDLDEPLRYKPLEANRFAAGAVNQWAKKKNKGPSVKATASKKGVRIKVTGRNRQAMKKALADAEEVRDEAFADYRKKNGFTLLKGKVIPDHTRHVDEYSDDVKPVMKALGGPTQDPRVFAEKALSFVQSIPYEKASLKRDRYRRPLSLLGRNRGDCDSKVVLYLALMKAAYPRVDSAVIYIPGHAYAALGLDPQLGEAKIRKGGSTWLLVEPVGPAVVPLGTVGRKSRRRARTGRVTLVET